MECSKGTHLVGDACEPVGMHPLFLGIFVPLGIIVGAIGVWSIFVGRLPRLNFKDDAPEEMVRSQSELE